VDLVAPLTRLRRSLLAIAVVATGASVASQGRAPATPASAASTSAILFGQVVDADTGDPIEDATVTLTGRPVPARKRSTPPAAGGSLFDLMAVLGNEGGTETAASAGNGRFVFRGLPVAYYSVRATAAGYVDTAFGLRGPAGSAPVEIREGQSSARVTLRLLKQAVVTGVVLDEGGEPVIGANVRAFRRSISRLGRPSFERVDRATTDDRGMYRLAGLAPGEYLMFVPQSQSTSPAAAADAFMQSFLTGRMPEGGLGSLAAGGASPMDPRAIRVGDWRLLSANVQSPAAGDGALQVYRTVFYSSALTPADATWMTLKSGEERGAVDFAIQPVTTGRINGTVVGAAGSLGGISIRLLPAGERRPGDPPPQEVATGQTQPDGGFTLLAVPAGQYRVVAKRDPPRELPADLPEELASNPFIQMGMNMQRGAGRTPLFGEAAVTVAPGGTVDVAIAGTEGVTMSGRLEFQDGETPAKNEIARSAVTLRPLDGTFTESRTIRPAADATFTSSGLLPGRYGLTTMVMSQGSVWFVKKVTAGGRDVTTTALAIEDKPIADVVVTLTSQAGTVRGTVRRDAGAARDARTGTPPPLTAIAVPANYMDWTDLELLMDRVQLWPVGDDGTFRMGRMLTGEYLVAVVDETQVDIGGGMALLRSLAAQATRLTVNPGDGNTISLAVARLPR